MIEEHVKVVLQSAEAVRLWRKANTGVQIDLREANLDRKDLHGVDLYGANLTRASLIEINLSESCLQLADLMETNLTNSTLIGVDLTEANLSRANLEYADLGKSDLSNANLSHADLNGANLIYTNLIGANLTEALLSGSTIDHTIFSNVDLSGTRGLDEVVHWGPSPISTSTLRFSKGKIPDLFLRGCGLQPWEVLHAKLYDPLLAREQKAEIHNEVFQKMVGPPIGGVFISYSHENMEFAEQLDTKLNEKEYSVWRDEHSLVAGPLERQIFDAIRAHDVVLLVLSEASVNSDWVELELEKAVAKEKEEGREVLCPVALDDSWKDKLKQSGSQVLWRKVKEKNVLDFSGDFDEPFQKLLTGMSRYYGSEQQGS